MANDITNAVATMFARGLRKVPREHLSGLMAVSRDNTAEQASKNDTVDVTVVGALSDSDFSPSMSFTKGDDSTLGKRTLTLSNEKKVSWNMTAEEERALENSGNAQEVMMQRIEQGLRTIANRAEANVLLTAKNSASRAFGTSGTTPLASDLSDIAKARQILKDNGAGVDRHLILDSDAELNFLGLTQLTNVNQAGSDRLLREAALGDIFGLLVHSSSQVASHTAGDGTGYLVNNASGYAVGATELDVDTGTGTILAGDVLTIGDYQYVVKTALSGGTVVIQEPGLRAAVADNAAITVNNSYTGNVFFDRGAIVSVVRPGLQPSSPDISQSIVTDPVSGISALLYRKVGDGMASWYMRSVYDSFAPNPYAIGTMLG